MAILAVAAPASASPQQVIRDCADDGSLSKDYSNKDLRGARDNLPAELDEYSDCRSLIAAALKGGSDNGGGRNSPGSGVGGAGAADPGEAGSRANDARDLEALTGSGAEGGSGGVSSGSGGSGQGPNVNVGGEDVEPGSGGLFDLSSASNDMPTPLLLALIAVGVLALAGGIFALRKRVPALGRLPVLKNLPTPRVPFAKRR